MGVDYGRRRIGVAVTDESAVCVRGLDSIVVRHDNAVQRLCAVVAQEKPEQVIFGVPLDENGGETAMSREVRAFARRVGTATGCGVRFVEESFSSHDAQRLAMHRRRNQRRDKGMIDRLAACLILEQYLRETE